MYLLWKLNHNYIKTHRGEHKDQRDHGRLSVVCGNDVDGNWNEYRAERQELSEANS